MEHLLGLCIPRRIAPCWSKMLCWPPSNIQTPRSIISMAPDGHRRAASCSILDYVPWFFSSALRESNGRLQLVLGSSPHYCRGRGRVLHCVIRWPTNSPDILIPYFPNGWIISIVIKQQFIRGHESGRLYFLNKPDHPPPIPCPNSPDYWPRHVTPRTPPFRPGKPGCVLAVLRQIRAREKSCT